jgi:hypothetical protein
MTAEAKVTYTLQIAPTQDASLATCKAVTQSIAHTLGICRDADTKTDGTLTVTYTGGNEAEVRRTARVIQAALGQMCSLASLERIEFQTPAVKRTKKG